MMIVDVNHGGLILAEEYLNLGYDVDIYDIYQKIKKSDEFRLKYKKLKEKHGDKINLFFEPPSFKEYESVIAPIHCPIDCRFIPFTDAVSEILKEKFGNIYKKIINVTGVKGKTTTTSLIYHILNNKYNVYLHNSNHGSIAPPTILNLLNNINIDDYEFFVFETSLGLIKCRYGVITNILENYKIARGKRTAFFAKFSTLKNAKSAYVNKKDLKRHNISIYSKSVNVINTDNAKVLNKYPLTFEYDGSIFKFNKNIFGMHFIENSIFSVEVCKNLMDLESIKDRLYSFNIKNRMQIKKINNNLVVKNINPGLDIKAIHYAINDFLEVFDGDVFIGGDYGIVCEEIDIEKLVNILKNFKCQYIFVGEIGKDLIKYLSGKYIKNFSENYVKRNSLIILRKKLR